MTKSDLPFGSEFSPQQIDLPTLLTFVLKNNGNWRGLEEDIHQQYFSGYNSSEYNRKKLANNCKLGLIGYGLIDRDGNATQLCMELLGVAGNEKEMYTVFARHILLNLKGIVVVQTAMDMRARAERFDLPKFREWLAERGINLPRGSKNISTMRLWLEKAGVVKTPDWEIDEKVLAHIIGADIKTVDETSSLTVEQKAFLKTLANLADEGSHASNEIEKLATATYGVRFNEKNLPKSVLYPLEDLGYISLSRGTKQEGRGAKPFAVLLTDKLKKDLITPLLESIEQSAFPDLRPLLRKSLAEILDQVQSSDKHKKGLALEALAFYLMRLIDLRYVATRLRGASTGGAEIDMLFEGERLLFSRWQIQCKNTGAVSLDDVAKEVGLTFQMKSTVVMIVSTGSIGTEAKKYAQDVMRQTNLNIVFVDGRDLGVIAKEPVRILDVLSREAKKAMEIKKLEF